MCRTAILVKDFLNNKDLDYRFYLALLYNSYFNSEENTQDYRTFNSSDFFKKKEELLNKMKISDYTFNKGINKILKNNAIIKKNNNEVIEIKVKEEGKMYTIIDDFEIEKLLELSNNEIKVYLAIKFIVAGSKDFKPIRLTAIATMCGLSKGATHKTIKKIINNLRDNDLLEIDVKNTKEYINDKFLYTNTYIFKVFANEI